MTKRAIYIAMWILMGIMWAWFLLGCVSNTTPKVILLDGGERCDRHPDPLPCVCREWRCDGDSVEIVCGPLNNCDGGVPL